MTGFFTAGLRHFLVRGSYGPPAGLLRPSCGPPKGPPAGARATSCGPPKLLVGPVEGTRTGPLQGLGRALPRALPRHSNGRSSDPPTTLARGPWRVRSRLERASKGARRPRTRRSGTGGQGPPARFRRAKKRSKRPSAQTQSPRASSRTALDGHSARGSRDFFHGLPDGPRRDP